MADWLEYAKIAGAFVGAGGIATIAKLYHDRIVAGKETELIVRAAEIARLKSDLGKAEARAKSAEEATLPSLRDLARLRDELTEIVERHAKSIHAQAASLYIPVFNARDEQAEFPRGFAFVAVYNSNPTATLATLRLKLVESWTIVGECWAKDTVVGDNELQANARHVASYDEQTGFTPVHTLVSPVEAVKEPRTIDGIGHRCRGNLRLRLIANDS